MGMTCHPDRPEGSKAKFQELGRHFAVALNWATSKTAPRPDIHTAAAEDDEKPHQGPPANAPPSAQPEASAPPPDPPVPPPPSAPSAPNPGVGFDPAHPPSDPPPDPGSGPPPSDPQIPLQQPPPVVPPVQPQAAAPGPAPAAAANPQAGTPNPQPPPNAWVPNAAAAAAADQANGAARPTNPNPGPPDGEAQRPGAAPGRAGRPPQGRRQDADYDEIKATLDGVSDTLRDMVGAIKEAGQTACDPDWSPVAGFRAHYEGGIAKFFRRIGFASQPKSLLQPDDTMIPLTKTPYVPQHLRTKVEVIKRAFAKRARFGVSYKVVQYVLMDLQFVGCVKHVNTACRCAVCADNRLSRDLAMQLRRKNPMYAWYLRFETTAFGLRQKVPQVVQIPLAIAQEYMRVAVTRPWSDSDFELEWPVMIGRINVNCTNYVAEQSITRIFCRDWWVAVHHRLDFHVPEN